MPSCRRPSRRAGHSGARPELHENIWSCEEDRQWGSSTPFDEQTTSQVCTVKNCSQSDTVCHPFGYSAAGTVVVKAALEADLQLVRFKRISEEDRSTTSTTQTVADGKTMRGVTRLRGTAQRGYSAHAA